MSVSGREYRAWLRYPSRRIASCQFADSDDDSWLVHIHDISRTGLSLLCAHKFELGTILRIGDADENAHLLAARVVQVNPVADEKWTMDCTFLKELSEENLRAWLNGKT